MEGVSKTDGSSAYLSALRILTFLFCLRVLGQLIQVAYPVSWLPSLHAWQGSRLPYPVLLALQLVIIFLMLRVVRRHASGSSRQRPHLGKWLFFGGAVYFLIMAARLFIGVTDLSDHLWFHRPIPALFHLVLASFVLLLASFHLNWLNKDQT